MTGTMQNYARKHVIAIDKLNFQFKMINLLPDQVKEKPEDGCYIHGMFLEGAK
jgi:dynein heavy chain